MRHTENLTKKEQLFCGYCARLGDPPEAARQAGYKAERAGQTAAQLLAREEICREIDRLRALERRQDEAAAMAGLRRLALGPVNGAAVLAAGGDLSADEVAGLDLFALSELRRPKGGGWELRFHDRIRALDLLLEHSRSRSQQEGGSLLDALEKGAAALCKQQKPVETRED